MRFYKLDPEVAGGWGPNTVFSRPPGQQLVIHKFHYQFDGWLGDEWLESDPCFIVTQRLADAIRNAGLSGYVLKPVETSTSEQFQEICPHRHIPIFEWLDITGRAGVDDFGVDVDGRLVVSGKALAVIKSTDLNHCEVSGFTKSSA